jgi:alkylation response protein AidB-like acyl-CoA dehydrogenase
MILYQKLLPRIETGTRAGSKTATQKGHVLLTDMDEVEQTIVETVRTFVDRDVLPAVQELEHGDVFPGELIEGMKKLGIYGLLVPEEHGGTDVSMVCFAAVTEELARGWMSLAGAMGDHSVVVYLLRHFGTAQQQRRYLPRLATGEMRATMALTEPGGGSDLQAITTTAQNDGDGFRIKGTKTWITNARRSGLMALLCKTNPTAEPPHKGISVLLVEPDHGYEVSQDLAKLGYKGVESCEVVFDDVHVPSDAVLGNEEGAGFAQMMRGLEVGRVQVAARALGVGQAAMEAAVRYAQQRETFGKQIWKHQSVGNHLADMTTHLQASRLLTLDAARAIDEDRRSDMEAGMAKLFASETAMQISLDAVRVHGGYGYSTEFDVERYFRDAPLMIVGEGTNEILRSVIARQLVDRNRIS